MPTKTKPKKSSTGTNAIRQRLVEYLGGEDLEHATSAYIARCDGCDFAPENIKPPSTLDSFLEKNCDIARALYDSESLIAHLDVEYVNFDSPAEAYLDPWRTFRLQEPAVDVIEELLVSWGIQPLHLVTGQGHHFVWRVRRHSTVEKKFGQLLPLPERSRNICTKLHVPFVPELTPQIENAFAGLGLVMEYLAHCIKRKAAARCEIPVEITAVAVGPVLTSQREMISIDISEYGDPLFTRMVRMPFTDYRKPWQTGLARALGVEDQIPRILTIPLHEMDVARALQLRQVPRDVRALAHRVSTRIPDATSAMTGLLDEYLASKLRTFHEEFYAANRRTPKHCTAPLDQLPPCARHILENPNELLLKPAGMQLVTRSLLALGWHPRGIARLIRSRFEDPRFGWGDKWKNYDPGMRADFYTRLFTGLIKTGVDELVDFNCVSCQEKGLCFNAGHGCNLEPLKVAILETVPL